MADPNIVDHVGLWQIVPAEQCPQVKTGLDSSFSSHSPCCFKPWKPFVTTLYNKIRLWAGNSDLFRTPFLKKVRIRTIIGGTDCSLSLNTTDFIKNTTNVQKPVFYLKFAITGHLTEQSDICLPSLINIWMGRNGIIKPYKFRINTFQFIHIK